jgi:hypothetical protein
MQFSSCIVPLDANWRLGWYCLDPPLKFADMCNLYSMTRNREAILRLFRVSPNRAAA